MEKLVIIGAGGHAREIVDIVMALNNNMTQYELLGYVIDHQFGNPSDVVYDYPVLGGFDWLEVNHEEVKVICGVGYPQHRYQLISKAKLMNCQFVSIIHPSAIITGKAVIGSGVIITAGCILTNNIKIGDHVHLNVASTISHDTTIEDYVTISPGAHIAGNVLVGSGSFVGTGANLIEGTKIGKWSIIGAGSTIISDVPGNSTVVGVPGKVIKKHKADWYK